MKVSPVLLMSGLLAVTGCASQFILPPPGIHHPADPLAESAPIPPASTTLVTSPDDADSPTVNTPSVKDESNPNDPGIRHEHH